MDETHDVKADAPQPAAPASLGERLREAREAKGLSLDDVATQTRVNRRLLEAIERGAVDELPIGPYAVGFTRSFASAVDLDPNAAGDEMRTLMYNRTARFVPTTTEFEPADASRTPSRALALAAAAIAGLAIAGWLIWQATANKVDVPTTSTAAAAPAAPASGAAPTAAATPQNTPAPAPTVAVPPIADNAPVLISASQRVWFSLEDAAGRSQFDLTLNPGEFYTLKPTQRSLFLRTGSPQNLRILVGGQALPAIGAPNQVVSGYGLDSASLARRRAGVADPARPAVPAATTASPLAAPTTGVPAAR